MSRWPGPSAERGMRRIPGQVVADIQIEVAVTVEVGEGGRGRPVAPAVQSGVSSRVLERAVAPIVQQEIRPEPRDEQIGPAVVVVIGAGHAEAISAANPRDPGALARILERPVSAVAEQAVAQLGPGRLGPGWEGSTLDEIDIEPAVAVIVEDGDAATDRLGDLVLRRLVVVVGEAEPGGVGIVAEGDRGGALCVGWTGRGRGPRVHGDSRPVIGACRQVE